MRTHVSATPGLTRMRCIQPDGTGTDLGTIDLSQDMFAVLRDLHAAGASPDVNMVRTLRQHFHVRFDVHTHRARLDAYRVAVHYGAFNLLDELGFLVDEVIATERASLKRVRARASPTGRPNIGSKAARAAARVAKRAA